MDQHDQDTAAGAPVKVDFSRLRSGRCRHCHGQGCEWCHNTGANLEPEEETVTRWRRRQQRRSQ